MATCDKCAAPFAAGAKFCASCGAGLAVTAVTSAATEAMPGPAVEKPRTSPPSRAGSAVSVDEGRFPPGTVLAGRYRISGLLGRGGMGEVFRANDLALGQTVALKFLPESLSGNPQMVARFYGEVRIARKVSHPNVCRVYDIGEIDGFQFISMEYVDGEDLGSLLRRIGRLPVAKATEIARKLCAGVAAAHEKGILHRDLKPANIMLDRQGQVYVMDFGLAGLADQLEGAEIRNGTPAYMSPEQLAGREVTVRSDIYSLGLVIYEIYTGRRPFQAKNLAELMRMQEQAKPDSLSSQVQELDPAVERVVEKCLSPDPQERPVSAMSVAAGLPGGNALAEAIAAGETPSPELVAASGASEGMSPKRALACLAACLAGIALVGALVSAANQPTLGPLELSPEVLAHKAREAEAKLGYRERLPSAAGAFEWNAAFLQHMREKGNPLLPFVPGPEQNVDYWYRESPLALAPDTIETQNLSWGRPAFDVPGGRRLRLDPMGNLIQFEALPQPDTMAMQSPEPDWNGALAAAGLDPAKLVSAPPQWTPTQPFDARMAWTGPAGLRVEAAAWKGKLVWLRSIPAWDKPRAVAASAGAGVVARDVFQVAVFTLLVLGAALLAWRNAKRNRGDRRGAARLASVAFGLLIFAWIVGASHTSEAGPELLLIVSGTEVCLLFSAILYVLYLAIEPWFRRRRPQALVTWTRVLAGQIGDPLVASDLLVGVLFGLAWAALYAVRILAGARAMIGLQVRVDLDTLQGARFLLSDLLGVPLNAIRQTFFALLCVLILQIAVRREWLAAVAFAVVFGAGATLGSPAPLVDFPYFLAANLLFVFLLTRFGLLCAVTTYGVFTIFYGAPITMDTGAWYSGASFLAMAVVASISVFAFRSVVSGRPLFVED